MTTAISAEGLVRIYRSRRQETQALDGVDRVVVIVAIFGRLGVRRYRNISR